jgi:two-component system, cell cycle response regulator
VSNDFAAFALASRIFLESEGYEVRTATDALETLELAQTWRPDPITTDIMKPLMDGLAMTRRLKADEATKHIPVLVLSATLQRPEMRQAALDAGACVLVVAPIEDYREFARSVREGLGLGVQG